MALSPVEADLVGGCRLTLRNSHATDSVSLGPAGVTAGAGFGLPAGAVVTVELTPGDGQLFGIRDAAADITVHVLRCGV